MKNFTQLQPNRKFFSAKTICVLFLLPVLVFSLLSSIYLFNIQLQPENIKVEKELMLSDDHLDTDVEVTSNFGSVFPKEQNQVRQDIYIREKDSSHPYGQIIRVISYSEYNHIETKSYSVTKNGGTYYADIQTIVLSQYEDVYNSKFEKKLADTSTSNTGSTDASSSSDDTIKPEGEPHKGGLESAAKVIKEFLDKVKVPFAITLAIAGGFMALFLGIALAKAEDSSAASNIKKRMFQLLLGVFLTIVLIFFLDWLLGNIGSISDTIKDQTSESSGTQQSTNTTGTFKHILGKHF